MISIPFYPMQLPDVHDLLMFDPSVALMLIDQPRFDSRRSRTLDVDRIYIASKSNCVRTDAEALECDLKNPRVGLRHADNMRVDYHVEERRQPESLRVRFDLPLRIRHDRKLVPRRLERLERLDDSRPHHAPQSSLAM